MAFDSDGAAYLTEEWKIKIEIGTWYQIGEEVNTYAGPDPISSVFTGNDIYSSSYFNTLTASFSNQQ